MKTKKIAEFLNGNLVGDDEIEISGVADLEKAAPGEIAFLEKEELSEAAQNTKASCLLVPENFDAKLPCSFIKVKNPKLAFAKVAAKLHPPKQRAPEIHPTAIIAENAKISKDVFVGAFCCVGENSEIGDATQLRAGAKIGDNVRIGKNCVLHPNVFIGNNCTIGDRVILHAGVVIGADGFGYVRDGAN